MKLKTIHQGREETRPNWRRSRPVACSNRDTANRGSGCVGTKWRDNPHVRTGLPKGSSTKTYANGCSKLKRRAVYIVTTQQIATLNYPKSMAPQWKNQRSGGSVLGLEDATVINYQAVLLQKLRQLRQVGNIEGYNGKYSSLIFHVKNMSDVDQVNYFYDELKRTTQTYFILQNPISLSLAMDQAVKYDMLDFGGRERPECDQHFRGPSRSSLLQDKMPFRSAGTSPGSTFLPSRPRTTRRTIKVKLGDNKIGESVLELIKIEVRLQDTPNYHRVVVVFDISEEFDCGLGMSFFVDVQSDIDWKRRCFKKGVLDGASGINSSTPCGKRFQGNGSGNHDAVKSENLLIDSYQKRGQSAKPNLSKDQMSPWRYSLRKR
ncbi:LOW QUALITY PROTEIN: Hypothetical protein PHPALM_149 [Phytophthora palmivora]|uniref:Uncharacterized protein n=1 Tax=Phytophthora palmivora TaxID=4796 RepID=A0A2P4YVK0_9STRA|nr:LOW QUALITY PROTEIN: Hypothetical protein PHPALM_149 [Phytophthora palmivora]